MIVERNQCDNLEPMWFRVMARSLRKGKERRDIFVKYQRGRVNWKYRWIEVSNDGHNDAQVAYRTPENDSYPVAPG